MNKKELEELEKRYKEAEEKQIKRLLMLKKMNNMGDWELLATLIKWEADWKKKNKMKYDKDKFDKLLGNMEKLETRLKEGN